MCGDVSGQPSLIANGYPDSRCLEQKLMRANEHNAKLLQQQREQERCLREMQNELAQLREEDNAKRVARFAQEKASCVLRHEEQIQKLRHHYEQQLAALEPSGQVRQVEIDRLRHALADEQHRATQAEAAREAADASANRQKRKLLKLQQHQSEHAQNTRKRFRRWASGATKRVALDQGRLVFSLWRVAARRLSSERDGFDLEARRWATVTLTEQTRNFRPTILALIAARPMISALAALRAWASVVTATNDRIQLQSHMEHVQRQSAVELSSLRWELKYARASHRTDKQELVVALLSFVGWMSVVRAQKEKRKSLASCRGVGALAVVQGREQMFLLRTMLAWATAVREVKHASRLTSSLDEASAIASARMEAQGLRIQRRKIAADVIESRAIVCLVAPFGAWAREALQSQLRRRRGDVVLNSGEAAKRATKALEDARAQHEQELTACKKEVAEYCEVATTASRAKRRAYTVSERLQRLLGKELKETMLETVLRRWRDAILTEKCAGASKSKYGEKRSFAALESMTRTVDSERIITVVFAAWRKETLALLHEKAMAKSQADASRKSEVALACVHRESRKALQTAWGSSCEASRRKATFERRQAAESDASLQNSIREILREGPRPVSRSGTAREIEEQFENMEKQARDRVMVSRPVSRSGTAREIEEHFENIEKQARDRLVVSGSTTPSTVASSGIMVTEANLHLPNSLDREARRCIISDLLDLRRGESMSADMQSIALVLQSWRCQTAESLRERWVQAAREGRKGLFVAALAQQARYWMADGFHAWKHWRLEARCERLQAAADQLAEATTSAKASPGSRKGKTGAPLGQESLSGSSRSRRISN
jgi:hypothetical protein